MSRKYLCWCPDDGETPERHAFLSDATSSEDAAARWADIGGLYRRRGYAPTTVFVRSPNGKVERFSVFCCLVIPQYSATLIEEPPTQENATKGVITIETKTVYGVAHGPWDTEETSE